MAPDLFIPKLKAPVSPSGTRQPRLWVRRIVIFEDENTILRDLLLKPGLNIIWTPDLSSSGRRSLAHGSGKTTLCRLIRACLGETEYATEIQRDRILHKLPKGFFAAEVIVDGICWVSVRSFGLGASFTTKADTIESVVSRGQKDDDLETLDPILHETFFAELAGLVPPEIGDEHTWDVLRAWMSRDQECRLADILSWRSPKTHSRSRAQVISEAAKLAAVRLAVGALDKKELQAGIKERKLSRKAEEQRKRQSFLDEQRASRLKALRTAFDVGKEVGLEDSLDQKGLISLATARFESSMGAALPTPPEPHSAVSKLRELNEAKANKTEEQRNLFRGAEQKREKATALRSEAEIGQVDVKQGYARVCPVCRVPVSEVLATKCGISLELCNIETIKAEIAEKKAEATRLEKDASEIESVAQQIPAAIEEIEKQIREVEKQAEKAEEERRKALNAKLRLQDRVFEARRLLDEARSLREELNSETPTDSMNEELEMLRAQLEEGRVRARSAILSLENQYRAVMAAWLPDGVDGVIKLDGNGLKVDVELDGRGEVSTAALDSLKIVAFDLAVLHLATEGKAILPPLLIHDSPREADLDGMLYERLFEIIAEWESDSKTPGFQYIVTTTTAPPPSLRGDNFVRLKMSSTPATERLFKIDI